MLSTSPIPSLFLEPPCPSPFHSSKSSFTVILLFPVKLGEFFSPLPTFLVAEKCHNTAACEEQRLPRIKNYRWVFLGAGSHGECSANEVKCWCSVHELPHASCMCLIGSPWFLAGCRGNADLIGFDLMSQSNGNYRVLKKKGFKMSFGGCCFHDMNMNLFF